MATKLEIVSQLTNILKLNNKDNRSSRRFLLHLLNTSATTFISQKFGERSILSELNLYSHIPCFEFEKIEAKYCSSIEFRLCKTLMKSKKPLPKLIFSRLSSSIRYIISLDGEFRFTFVDEVQYRRNKSRQYKLKNEVYVYLGADNHLYIPDQEIYTVDLTVLTTNTEEIENCSSCLDKGCKSNWIGDFICPDKLLNVVMNDVLQRLGIFKQVIEDRNPNGIEGA